MVRSFKVSNEEDERVFSMRYGHQWQGFMEEHYPKDAAKLKKTERWEELAYEIEKEAHHLKDILREQYARVNPRPQEGFMEILNMGGKSLREFPNTRGFHVEHEVMEQIVLQYRA